MSDATDRPYFFNVTIPRIEIPQRKRRELSDQRDHVNFAINIHEGRDIPREKRQSLIDEIPRLNIQPSEAELVKTIGYYTCGIKSRFIPQFLSTEPVLVRYSGKMHIFAGLEFDGTVSTIRVMLSRSVYLITLILERPVFVHIRSSETDSYRTYSLALPTGVTKNSHLCIIPLYFTRTVMYNLILFLLYFYTTNI